MTAPGQPRRMIVETPGEIPSALGHLEMGWNPTSSSDGGSS